MKSSGLKRVPIDKYYTKDEAVQLCMTYVKSNVHISEEDLIIEPSAGAGAFIQRIEILGTSVRFLDIKPENENIEACDFLSLNINRYDHKGKVYVIGNPPFGRQSSLALKFIKHATEFCDAVCFILPRSFKKESMKKKINPFFHCILEEDLPEYSFSLDGNKFDVPCVFQIWTKRSFKRSVAAKENPKRWAFVKKESQPDISLRRVGAKAGHVDRDVYDKSIQSHYFIKFDKMDHDLFTRLKELRFEEAVYTVGPRSISKGEVIAMLNVVV